MKTSTLIILVAAVLVLGGACVGISMSGILNDNSPVIPDDPIVPPPTETPVEPEEPEEPEVPLSYFSTTVSSHSSSSEPEPEPEPEEQPQEPVKPEETQMTVDDFKELFKDAGDEGSGDVTIEISEDIKLTGEWTPINVDGYNGAGIVTVNGNGHTISGLTAPLFAGGFAGKSGIVINDLTIADSDIDSKNTLGSGAFIETIDSMPLITLTDCHVKNSKINGSRTGGLIGWNSGYDVQNNGPVKTKITIEDCTVTDCEIIGAGTVGGIVGHAGANAWTWNNITNCKVENCKLTSNDDSYRVGAIVGTANVGHVKIEDCTFTGNTFVQNNNGVEIPRPDGQSELYGRAVLGSTGSLTIKVGGTTIYQEPTPTPTP